MMEKETGLFRIGCSRCVGIIIRAVTGTFTFFDIIAAVRHLCTAAFIFYGSNKKPKNAFQTSFFAFWQIGVYFKIPVCYNSAMRWRKNMFRVSVKQINRSLPEEVEIRCYEINNEVKRIVELIRQENLFLLGSEDGETFQIRLADIYYIESVDNKTFIYLRDKVLRSKMRLYEIEGKLAGTKLFRCSKSMILNIGKIKSVSSSVNSRLEANLLNGEKVMITRQYVKDLKKILGM